MISFREGLEASLVVIVVMNYLHAAKSPHSIQVYYGISAAIIVSLALAFTVGYAYSSYGDYFEALMGAFAVCVLVAMIVFMKRHSGSISKTLHQKLERGINASGPSAVFIISFTTVLREGVEAVIFISPFIFLSEAGSVIGSAAGLALVIVIYAAISSATRKMNINIVFKWTSLALIVFASAILAMVLHNLQNVHLLPVTRVLLTYSGGGYLDSIVHSVLVLLIGFDGASYTLVQCVAYTALLLSLLLYFFRRNPVAAVRPRLKGAGDAKPEE